VSDLGKLTAHVHYQMRGDNEFVLRVAFRRTPPSQWKDLGQTLLTLDGLHGEVTLAKSSDPLDTRGPFGVDIEYTQSNFLDWASSRSRMGLPLLSIGMPDAPKNAALPITLGSPLRVVTHLALSFPLRYGVSAPVGIAITRDYATFQSSYRWKDGTLTADRSLDFKMRELPASGRGDYLAFTHGVEADQTQQMNSSRPGAPRWPRATRHPRSLCSNARSHWIPRTRRRGTISASHICAQRISIRPWRRSKSNSR
jgi:hypothetical protein